MPSLLHAFPDGMLLPLLFFQINLMIMQPYIPRDLDKIEYSTMLSYFTRHSSDTNSFRRTMKSWLVETNPTHLVTVNFNKPGSVAFGRKELTKWYERIHEKIYNRRDFEKIIDAEKLKMRGFPEYTLKGMLHFHIAAEIPEGKVEKFIKCAERTMQRIVISGDVDIRPIGRTLEELEAVASYITKGSIVEAYWLGGFDRTRKTCRRRGAPRRHTDYCSSTRSGL